jgi:hypothetical protein
VKAAPSPLRASSVCTRSRREKTLHANLGGHAGVPWFEVDDAARFFTRHLK